MTTTIRTPLSPAASRRTHTDFAVGVVQMASRTGAWHDNVNDASDQVRALARTGTRVIVLPELFATGYDLSTDIWSVAESVPGPTTEALTALALETDTVIVTALITRGCGNTVLDSSVVVGRDGVLGVGHKRFLWGDENEIFTASADSGLLVPTPHGTVGVVICYEAGFPETVRHLAMNGAQIIAVPSAFGHVRLHIWKLLTRSRALENGVVVAAAGLTGQSNGGPRFAGHSVIVGPQGNTLVEMSETTGSVSAVVKHDSLTDARAEVPYLTDLARLGGITENDPERIPDV